MGIVPKGKTREVTGNFEGDFRAGACRALCNPKKEAPMSSLAIYLIGLVIFIAGLVYGAHLLHVPEKWIGVGLVVLVGLGVLMGAIKTRQRDSSGS